MLPRLRSFLRISGCLILFARVLAVSSSFMLGSAEPWALRSWGGLIYEGNGGVLVRLGSLRSRHKSRKYKRENRTRTRFVDARANHVLAILHIPYHVLPLPVSI